MDALAYLAQVMREVARPSTDSRTTERTRDRPDRAASAALVGVVLDGHHNSPPDAWLSGAGTFPR